MGEGLRPPTDMDRSAINIINFVKFVGLLDMDPIAWENVKQELQEVDDKRRPCTIATTEAMAAYRAQVNPMAEGSIGLDSVLQDTWLPFLNTGRQSPSSCPRGDQVLIMV